VSQGLFDAIVAAINRGDEVAARCAFLLYINAADDRTGAASCGQPFSNDGSRS